MVGHGTTKKRKRISRKTDRRSKSGPESRIAALEIDAEAWITGWAGSASR